MSDSLSNDTFRSKTLSTLSAGDVRDVSKLLSSYKFHCVEINSNEVSRESKFDRSSSETRKGISQNSQLNRNSNQGATLKENIYGAECLRQYYYTFSDTDSEDDIFDDDSYECHLAWESLKRQRKLKNISYEFKENRIRKENSRNYYQKHCSHPESIFKQPGIKFVQYTSKKVVFRFVPCVIHPKYISPKFEYTVILCYKHLGKTSGWTLHKLEGPTIENIYKLFLEIITDKNLVSTIWKIYEIMKEFALQYARFNEIKHKKYLNGEEVELNSDDEKMFLNEKEQKERQMRREAVWKRMEWPQHLKPLNMRLD